MPIPTGATSAQSIAEIVGLPSWAVKAAFRLAQLVRSGGNGIYAFALHVSDDGIALYVTHDGKREVLAAKKKGG